MTAPAAVDHDVVTVYQATGRELAERVQAARAIHDAIDCGGGLIICSTCGTWRDYVIWPCPTLVALDAMPTP